MKWYVVLLKMFGDGYTVIKLKEYKRNELFRLHQVLDKGTKRQLRKRGWIL